MSKELPLSYYQIREIINYIALKEDEIKTQKPLCDTAFSEGVCEGKETVFKDLKNILKKKKAEFT